MFRIFDSYLVLINLINIYLFNLQNISISEFILLKKFYYLIKINSFYLYKWRKELLELMLWLSEVDQQLLVFYATPLRIIGKFNWWTMTECGLICNQHSYLIYKLTKLSWLVRFHELVCSGEGIAIIEQGTSFGAGNLIEFGINSNTSAKGFLKCTYRVSQPTYYIPLFSAQFCETL